MQVWVVWYIFGANGAVVVSVFENETDAQAQLQQFKSDPTIDRCGIACEPVL